MFPNTLCNWFHMVLLLSLRNQTDHDALKETSWAKTSKEYKKLKDPMFTMI